MEVQNPIIMLSISMHARTSSDMHEFELWLHESLRDRANGPTYTPARRQLLSISFFFPPPFFLLSSTHMNIVHKTGFEIIPFL